MWCEVRTQDEEETIIVHNDGEDVGEQSAANQDTVQVDDDGEDRSDEEHECASVGECQSSSSVDSNHQATSGICRLPAHTLSSPMPSSGFLSRRAREKFMQGAEAAIPLVVNGMGKGNHDKNSAATATAGKISAPGLDLSAHPCRTCSKCGRIGERGQVDVYKDGNVMCGDCWAVTGKQGVGVGGGVSAIWVVA